MFLVVQINNLQHCHGIIYTSVKIPIKKCARCKSFSVTNFSSCTSVQCSVEDRNSEKFSTIVYGNKCCWFQIKNLMQNLAHHVTTGYMVGDILRRFAIGSPIFGQNRPVGLNWGQVGQFGLFPTPAPVY